MSDKNGNLDLQWCHGCRLKLPSTIFSEKQLKFREKSRCRICTSIASNQHGHVFERFEELKKFRPRISRKKIRASWKNVRKNLDDYTVKGFTIMRRGGNKFILASRTNWRTFTFAPVAELNRSRIEYSFFFCPCCSKSGRAALDEDLKSLTFPDQIKISANTAQRFCGEFTPVENHKNALYKEYRSQIGFKILKVDGLWSVVDPLRAVIAVSKSKGVPVAGTTHMYYPPHDGWRRKLKSSFGVDHFIIDAHFNVEWVPKRLNTKCEHIYVGDLEVFMNEQFRRIGSDSVETEIIVSLISDFLQPSSLLYVPFKDICNFTPPPQKDIKFPKSSGRRNNSNDGW